MNDFTAPANAAEPAGAGTYGSDADRSYSAALQAAMEAPTPQARAKAVDALEALAKERAEAVPAGSADQSQEGSPAEGFDAPVSGLTYQFEQTLPPGVEIVDATALGALKGSLAEAGVPAEIGNAAFSDIARLSADGVYVTEVAYVEACGLCRLQLERVHGERANGLIADALSWIEDAVRANPALEEAATAALASPMAIQAAANMKRFGRRGQFR